MAKYDGIYRGDSLRTISFPLGGIGSGCVGLDGTGRLRDWEIFNRPNKGSYNCYTHLAVKAEQNGQVLDARALNADLLPPFMGDPEGFGHGANRYTMSGLPHFESCEFEGHFPMAQVRFEDADFPGKASLSAFNPFIPLDDKNSSLPAAFFTVELTNPLPEAVDYTVAFSLSNPSRKGVNQAAVHDGVSLVTLRHAQDDPGHMAIAVAETEGVSIQENWYRGQWFDSLGIYWQDFTAFGPIRPRSYEEPGSNDTTTLCVVKTCPAGQTVSFRFLLAWYYPDYVNYWNEANKGKSWKNYYATLFSGADDVAAYSLKNWDMLLDKTQDFTDTLYRSSLPPEAIEAVGANLEVLKSPTCLRLTDGSFYAFEGCNPTIGSCEGSCTHVWNYAFALPHLFPQLERSMRELDYTYNLRPNGEMPFRLMLPLGAERWNFRACVDGQMGGVIKMYREWKLGAGDEWLKKWWPSVRKSLEYAWSPENADRWDPDKMGVISGRQHHTLDMELFGPNSWLNTFYLAALRAASEMAEAMGESDFAAECLSLYKKGAEYTERELFNGEYYHQKIDLRDKSILTAFSEGTVLVGGAAEDVYWNPEAGQMKYQIGEGCGIDQVLAQWMSDMVGLGDILDPDHVRSALASIYRYNYKESFRKHFNPCRIYALNGEAGTVICEWPKGHEKPVVPVPYSEETMHGFEYQAASHMIKRGMEEAGLSMVRAIRDRYDGAKRNPWNEIECGSNYARSMASFALLLVYSGLVYDIPRGRLGMKPLKKAEKQQFLFSVSNAWGEMAFAGRKVSLTLHGGELKLSQWVLPKVSDIGSVSVNGEKIPFTVQEDAICMDITLVEGDVLTAE